MMKTNFTHHFVLTSRSVALRSKCTRILLFDIQQEDELHWNGGEGQRAGLGGIVACKPSGSRFSVPQYDLSAAQFSPDGRVFQIEYAMKAVENSG